MTQKISIEPVRTKIFSPSDSLTDFLRASLGGRLRDGAVVAVTSKIVSLAEGRLVPKTGLSKTDLIRHEADAVLGEGGHGIELTIKHGLLIPSAGIDESNSEGDHYILYPADPYESARGIGRFLRSEFNLERVAVIMTDSHSSPLRKGVTGISLAHWGLKATRSLAGTPDLFGRELKFTSVNVVDSLAAMAVFAMGEADDRCPLALIEGAQIEFTSESQASEISIAPQEDLYFPLFEPLIRPR